MSESLREFRIQKAIERGFIPAEEATETQVELGLEDMHTASLEAAGRYAVAQSVDVVVQAS
jgi:hypothetical protein